MNVFIDRGTISSYKSQISEKLDEYDTGMEDIQSTLDSISEIWQGKDHDTFTTRMNDFMSDLQELRKTINNYNLFIEAYINGTNGIDNYYANKKITLK